jgi:hypothetical protein
VVSKGIYPCFLTLCVVEWLTNKFDACALGDRTHAMHQHGAGRENESQFGA